MERITASLAGRVVQALLEAGFDKQFASERSEESLLKAMKEEVEKAEGNT